MHKELLRNVGFDVASISVIISHPDDFLASGLETILEEKISF